ncbi:MAG: flagellar biosynthetic protein FliR [Pedosphaera sp.]|nr:flagellar biosynthetic protein FliR [Pedosphaera sp.]MSU43427.1 flagellar biosynthetic protein FliR [Pedosphaera sp.]
MEQLFLYWFLIFVRASAMLSIFPIFSAAAVPIRLRIAIGGFLATVILPTLPTLGVDLSTLSLLGLIGLLASEVVIGLLFGYLCRLVLFAVALAGNLINTQLGLDMGSMVAPGEAQSMEVMGVVLQILAIMLLLSLDLHHTLLIGFQQSYEVLPIGGGHLSNELFDQMTQICGRTFMVAVKIAAPIIAVGIVVTVLLCMLARAVPQMNVFMEGFGIRLLVGITLLGAMFNMMAMEISNYMQQIPEDFVTIVRLLGQGK